MFYTVKDDLLSEIRVTPSIFDEDNIEGLCGNPNDNTTDDFTIQGSNTITNDIIKFQASWRLNNFFLFYCSIYSSSYIYLYITHVFLFACNTLTCIFNVYFLSFEISVFI